ncbi:hypothetical protein [Collinsella intestinalis]|uniref:hypothetical protein n=1 Tax=Collinsella intestinalis TaxID=147207 RepID=UPI00195AF6C0|nr:hypothetical protein [Collinsella intestinalis]MBM6683612.1 hypothetical protein [Collinsella intestinalis]
MTRSTARSLTSTPSAASPSPIVRVAEDDTLSPADAYLALERQLGSALKVATLLRGK